jgi:hypothetical protein
MEVRDRRVSTADVATAADNKGRSVDPMEEKSIARDSNDGREASQERGATGNAEEELSPLLSEQEEEDFRSRWNNIQTGFVDEPRRAVEQADELVAQTMQRLAQSFSDQKSSLETQWEKSEKISTEELRVALRRYRSFFDRLLSV